MSLPPTVTFLTPSEAKADARALRQKHAQTGNKISHSEALEIVAHHHGFRDWNTLNAQLKRQEGNRYTCGARLSGSYLSKAFSGTVVESIEISPGWHQLSLELDEAVDVVVFDSFSNFRKRIRITVGPDGHTKERTSNGQPQAQITF